jgi:hypothetical protein
MPIPVFCNHVKHFKYVIISWQKQKKYMLNQFGVSLPVLNTKEEEFMNNPRQSKAIIMH